MANTRTRTESFVWTDDEVELLLRVTLNYKVRKLQENVDWESCQFKYADIMEAFLAQYPAREIAGGKDFPHDVQSISKVQVSAKIKSIRGKYRQAVETGRQRGQGRVILLFFDLCKEIWGGSPASNTISSGIETGDLADDLVESSSSYRRTASPVAVEISADSSTQDVFPSLSPNAGRQRKDLLQAKLNIHRGEKLKRKLLTDPALLEDLKIRRRMLEVMEQSDRRITENLQQIHANIASTTKTIQESLSLMRDLLQQQQQQARITHPCCCCSNGDPPADVHVPRACLNTPGEFSSQTPGSPHHQTSKDGHMWLNKEKSVFRRSLSLDRVGGDAHQLGDVLNTDDSQSCDPQVLLKAEPEEQQIAAVQMKVEETESAIEAPLPCQVKQEESEQTVESRHQETESIGRRDS